MTSWTDFDATKPYWEHIVMTNTISSTNDLELTLKHLYGGSGYKIETREDKTIICLMKKDETLVSELNSRGVVRCFFDFLEIPVEIVYVYPSEDLRTELPALSL